MPLAGLDLHQKMVEAVILDDAGRLLLNTRFPATRPALEAYARRNLKWLAALKLDDDGRESLDRHLRQLTSISPAKRTKIRAPNS